MLFAAFVTGGGRIGTISAYACGGVASVMGNRRAGNSAVCGNLLQTVLAIRLPEERRAEALGGTRCSHSRRRPVELFALQLPMVARSPVNNDWQEKLAATASGSPWSCNAPTAR